MTAARKFVVRGRAHQVEEDSESVARAAEALGFIGDNYFRSELHVHDLALANGHEPKPVVFASNHSGMCFPWDGIILTHNLHRHFGAKLPFKTMVAPPLFRFRIMRLFGLKKTWSKFSVEANMENFELLMSDNQSALIYPEGIAGLGKGFNRRYQLQKFSTSSVRMCLKYGYDLVPVYTVNGEYINPFAYRIAWIDKVAQKLGIPFMPLNLTLVLVAVFPFVFYMAWPARLKFIVAPRIDIRRFFDRPYEELTNEKAAEITLQVQALMQAGLSEAVQKYEGHRYDFKGLFKKLSGLGWKSILALPFAWSVLFHRGFTSKPMSLGAKLRSCLICLSMVLPIVGWPLFFALICLDQPEFQKTKKAS